jgi:hypothetical protein
MEELLTEYFADIQIDTLLSPALRDGGASPLRSDGVNTALPTSPPDPTSQHTLVGRCCHLPGRSVFTLPPPEATVDYSVL